MSHFDDVFQFHQKFGLLAHRDVGHLTQRKLTERIEFMQEELGEFGEAVAKQDLAQQADALVDLVYVAIGTAVQLGLPWQALWDDVQRANMTKVRGSTARGHLVDVTKPPGWVGPQTDRILYNAGYRRDDWLSSRINEAVCRDDDQHRRSGPIVSHVFNQDKG